MASSTSVQFKLTDGTTVIVEREDLRQVYEELWLLSHLQGAISTAALLIDEAGRRPRLREPVNLNTAQSTALTRAIDHGADASR
jgi:hypothetical protein